MDQQSRATHMSGFRVSFSKPKFPVVSNRL